MMTLDEAIRHAEEMAELNEAECYECAEEHRQLAKWLKELKGLQEKQPHGEWIDKGEYAECSICGGCSGTQFDGVEPIALKTSFCPNCGADMREGEAE